MRVTLVQARMLPYRTRTAMQPLAMGVLAAASPPGVRLTLQDENVEPLDPEQPADLAAFSVHTFNARRTYTVADHFRRRGIPVVLGGVHPTLVPEEAQRHADAVVCGNAEALWPRVLHDAARRSLRPRYISLPDGPQEILAPDRNLYGNKPYLPLFPVQYGRGCPHACDFCSVHRLAGSTIIHRPVDSVLAEIEAARRRTVFFVDDNIFAYGDASLALFRALGRRRIRWIGQAGLDAVSRPETAGLLAASGCRAIFLGFETLSPAGLRDMKKTANQGRDYRPIIDRLQKAGVMVCGSFLFGYDADTAGSIRQALAFSLEKNLALAHFNPVFPAPGTALYDRLLRQGRLPEPEWWLSDRFRYGQLPFQPQQASAREIEGACFAARRRFNTYPAILRRLAGSRAHWSSWTNVTLFITANLASRSDILRKQGRRLE